MIAIDCICYFSTHSEYYAMQYHCYYAFLHTYCVLCMNRETYFNDLILPAI